jgi:tetratricopeptide (TPR) repeat protein/tRNA A-37 threonylcarbamoyl transferase component Bud32
MARNWRIGERIDDRWEIHNVLQGGAGVVYIVYDQQFREPFAAKTYRDDVFELAPEIAERFTQESLTWVSLDAHPNITRARMVKQVESKPFLFLEFVSGGDLRSWIGTPRLMEDLPQVLRFAIQFCDGMIHAIKKGILVHRDIKPQNCLISQGQTLKITDFGLARAFDEVEASKARKVFLPGMTIEASMGGPEGTCTHMAPEQFDDARRVDVRADIYSFGVMVYQMLTGELPFAGTSWEEMEQLHRTQPPPQVKNADKRLNDVIQTCMMKKADERFKNFEDAREWLGEIYERIVGKRAPAAAVGAEFGAEEWNNKGASLGILAKHEEAIACYDKALELSAEFAQALANKGVALIALGRLPEALACFEQALKLNPRLEAVWTHKGVALKAMGKIPEAMACYEEAIKLNPRFPEAWINKGVALRSMKKPEEALACYDRALRLNPQDEKAWSNKGNAQYALGRHPEAIASYNKALERNVRLDQTWLNKGMSLTVLGRYDEAMKCYDKAIEFEPNSAQAWFNKGVVLVNGYQKYRDALPYLEQAERLGAPQAAAAVAQCKQLLGMK